MKPKKFSHQAFNPVSCNCRTYPPACGNPQSPLAYTVWPDKNIEMFSVCFLSALYNTPVFKRFKYFLPFGKGIFFHDQVLEKGRREKAQLYKRGV